MVVWFPIFVLRLQGPLLMIICSSVVVLPIRFVFFCTFQTASDSYQCPISTRYLVLKRRLETTGFISLYQPPRHLCQHLHYQSPYQSRKSARTGFSALDSIRRFKTQPTPLLVMHTLFQVTIASQPEAQQLQPTELVTFGSIIA